MSQIDISSVPDEFLDLEGWLKDSGFKPGIHPLEKLVADEDKYIEQYFVPFPFFEEVGKAKCTFLFLNRGTGKSASRLMLEAQCERSLKTKEAALAVSCTDFHDLIQKDEVILEDHIEAILHEAVPRLYDIIIKTRRGKLIEGLAEEYKKDLAWFVQLYSQRLNPRSVARQIYQIQGLGEEERKKLLQGGIRLGTKALEEVTKATLPGVGLLIDVANTLAGIELSDSDNLKEIYRSPLDLMARFAEIAEALDIKHIYILIDRVDEYAQIYQYEKAAEMIKPLIEAIPLLEMSPYAFKFFLPAEIRDFLAHHLRSDRFDVYTYTWSKTELKKLFERRLSVCSDENVVPSEEERKSFLRLFEEPARDRMPNIVEEMLEYAGGSPRNLFKLAKTILDEHTRTSPISSYISLKTYERALSKFADEQIYWRALDIPSVKKLSQLNLSDRYTLVDLIKRDLKPNESDSNILQLVKAWEDKDRFYAPHFSLIDIVQSLGEPEVQAREIAKIWENAGLVSAHYKIIDESLARYLYAVSREEQDDS
jgi:hypothetical protein